MHATNGYLPRLACANREAPLLRVILVLMLAALLAPTLASSVGAQEPVADGPLLAGAAKRDITPPVGTPLFAYTARHFLLASADDMGDGATPRYLEQRASGPDTELYGKTFLRSEGVHSRVYANAYVLDDGARPVAIVLADLGAIPGELHHAVAERIADAGVDVPRERLMIGSTHTHGGPGAIFTDQGYALLGGDQYDPRVFTLVADQIAAAIEEAWETREPATLAIGEAVIPDASRNRARDAHVIEHGHDGDHVKRTARVLRLDAVDGRPLGVITNFAAHGTIVDDSDLLMTGDNQGIAARLVARGIAAESGQSEHDVVVTYLNGAQGDVSPIGAGPTFFEQVADAGARQAPYVLDAWRALDGQGTRDVELDARFKFLCFCGQLVEDGQRISVVPILGQEETHMPAPFQFPGHGSKTPLVIGPGAAPQIVRLQVMRINGYVMAAMPGEASVALGERIEREIAALPGVTAADVVGLANDYVSYMSTLGEYDYQSYEGTFNLYGRMTGPLFRKELVGMASALMGGAPVTSKVEAPEPPLPDVAPLALLPENAPSARSWTRTSEAITFVWAGGAPSVDHPVDAPMVRVLDATSGAVLADDLGFDVWLRYEKAGLDHVWSAEWRAPAGIDALATCIEVEGRYVASPGVVAPYGLASC